MALADELKPVGVLEGFCVQEIAVCIWRKRRACRFENGAIRDGADTMKRWHEEFADTEGNSLRLQAPLDQLAEVEAAFSKGHITGEPARWIREHLGSSYPDPAGRTPDGQPYVQLSDEAVAALRKDIAAERERLLALQTQALEIEKLLVNAAVKRAALPFDPWLNTLLRYEAANDKQFHRALERLTQLRRRRQAEAHAPRTGDTSSAAS